jgi:hypothetical protein
MANLTLAKKLRHLLLKKFRGAKLELRRSGEDRRLEGFLIWQGFDGLDQIDRQEKLWTVLNEVLTPEERRQLLIVFTMIPEEARAGARRPARTTPR